MPHLLQMFYSKVSKFGKKSNLVTSSSSVSDQCRMSLHKVMLQIIMQHSGKGGFMLFDKIAVNVTKPRSWEGKSYSICKFLFAFFCLTT